MKAKLKELGIPLAASVADVLPTVALTMTTMPKFSNGRDVETLTKRVFRTFSMDKQSPRQLEASHIVAALNAFLSTRKDSVDSAVVTAPQQSGAHLQAYASPLAIPSHPTPIASVNNRAIFEVDDEDIVADNPTSNESSSNLTFLTALQTIIDSMGLNTRDGVHSLRMLDASSQELGALALQLSTKLGISLDAAFNHLRDWQVMQESVEEQMLAQEQEQERAKAERRKAMLPIWRCGVCGRADKPWIACYVAPFIVRYEEVDL